MNLPKEIAQDEDPMSSHSYLKYWRVEKEKKKIKVVIFLEEHLGLKNIVKKEEKVCTWLKQIKVILIFKLTLNSDFLVYFSSSNMH